MTWQSTTIGKDSLPPNTIGDKVYLDATDIQVNRPLRKLAHCYLGPFKIEKVVGRHAYRLSLPKSMSCLHPVFPVVKLILALNNPIEGHHPLPPPEPEVINGHVEFEVKAILNSRVVHRKLEYLVKWKGYGIEQNSWEPATNVRADACVDDFCKANPGAP